MLGEKNFFQEIQSDSLGFNSKCYVNAVDPFEILESGVSLNKFKR